MLNRQGLKPQNEKKIEQQISEYMDFNKIVTKQIVWKIPEN